MMLSPSRRTLAAAPLLFALAAPVPALAGVATDAAGGCFARTYDVAHLAAHPRQRVERIWLGRSREAEADPAGRRFDAVLGFGFRLGGRSYSGVAYCRGASCSIEGDAGAFALARQGQDLRLTVGSHLALEGAVDVSPDLARSADDRVFRLRLSPPRACG